MSDANKSTPPWRSEVWRVMSGPEENRQTRWFLATLKDGDGHWSITEPGAEMFLRSDSLPDDALYAELATQGAIDLVAEEVEQVPNTTAEAWSAYHRMREEVGLLRRRAITAEPVKRTAVSDVSSAPPWRHEVWRLTHGPEGNRQTRLSGCAST